MFAFGQYVENYCFTSSTYYVPIDYAVERVSTERKSELQINYYRWMPFFLLFQAACFKLPSIIWKYFHGQSGIKYTIFMVNFILIEVDLRDPSW
jgi:hypothetical protein